MTGQQTRDLQLLTLASHKAGQLGRKIRRKRGAKMIDQLQHVVIIAGALKTVERRLVGGLEQPAGGDSIQPQHAGGVDAVGERRATKWNFAVWGATPPVGPF